MGRKSIIRERKVLNKKTKESVKSLIPLLQDQDLRTLTLDELAQLMGKSKSTLYSYFSTKEEIYQTAVKLVLADMTSLITPEAVQGEDMGVVLHAMMIKIGEGIEGITMEFLQQIQLYFPDAWELIVQFTDQLLKNLRIIYEQGMKRGTFRKFDIQLLLSLDKHFIMSIMTDAQGFNQRGMSLYDLVKEYMELRLSALRVG